MAHAPAVMSADTRRLLEVAAGRFSSDDQGAFLRDAGDAPASRSHNSTVSRQARHSRFVRARDLGVAASLLTATEDSTFADFLFTPEFGLLHPYSAGPYAKLETLMLAGNVGNPKGWRRLWTRAVDAFIGSHDNLTSLERGLVRQASVGVLFGAATVIGPGLGPEVQSVLKLAGDQGLMTNPFYHMNLTVLGSYTGTCDAYVEWVLDPLNLDFELADILCFVRRDLTPQLFECLASLARGESQTPAETLYPSNPGSTVAALLKYIRASMRRATHFNNPGLVLGVLTWTHLAARLIATLDAQGEFTEAQICGFKDSLSKVESVQLMEKQRFWQIVDSMPEGAARDRTIDLWNRSYA